MRIVKYKRSEYKNIPVVAQNFYQSYSFLKYLDETYQGGLYSISSFHNEKLFFIAKQKFKKFGFTVLWSPGGALSFDTEAAVDLSVSEHKFGMVIFGNFNTNLKKLGARLVGSEKTVLVDSHRFVQRINMSKNWRRNQRRAYQSGTVLRPANVSDLNEIVDQLEKLEEFKRIKLGIDSEFVRFVLQSPECLCLIAEDEKNNFLGFRAAYFSHSKSFDMIAVNSFEGKRRYVSYLLVTEIINEAYNRGVQYFDFGGIDKENNLSVYNFKKGIGGDEVFYCSELVCNLHPRLTKAIKILF